MFRKIQLPIENNPSLTDYHDQAILLDIPDGKKYIGDKDQVKTQTSQKGDVCWYNSLSRIRTHYGENAGSEFSHQRHIEKSISEYRKKSSSVYLYDQFVKAIFNKFIEENNNFLKIENHYQLDTIVDEKDYFSVHDKMVYQKIQNIGLRAAIFQKNNILDTQFNNLLSLLNDGGLQIRDLLEKNEKLDFFNTLQGIVSLVDNKSLDIKSPTQKRIEVFYLGLLRMLAQPFGGEKITLSQMLDLSNIIYKLMALEKLSTVLPLDKPSLKYCENILTTGVYNSLAIDKLKLDAKVLYDTCIKDWKLLIDDQSVDKTISALKNLYACRHTHAYTQMISLYGLKYSAWKPTKGFDALLTALQEEGALVVGGLNLGLPFYNEAPQVLLDDKEKPITMGSRSILFWNEKPKVKPESGHSILIIGAQSSEIEGKQENYVYFLDPNDKSEPNQERSAYRIPYEDLIDRIMTVDSLHFIKPVDEGNYAIFSPSKNY